MTLDERLDAYPLLPPDERAAVAREAAAHPEWAARLADAQALAATLDVAAPSAVTAADVARRETDRLLGHATPDADRIDAAIAADTALAAEAERVRARLAVLAATAEPPAAQFARLTAAAPAPTDDRRVRRAVADRVAGDRAPAAPVRAQRTAGFRRVLVAASVCVVAYTAALVGSSATRPERDRVADLRELSFAPSAMRGDGDSAEAARLADALKAVDDARQTTLGLFPRYDANALTAAANELAAVAASAEPASAVAQEARFALGRVRLQQGRDDEAARLLGALVRDGSYRAPEARRLLDWIRAQAAP